MGMSRHWKEVRNLVGSRLLLMPGVAAVIRDEQGRVLIQRRPDGSWSLPAGAIEPGESPADAVVREVREETGLVVRPTTVLGVFGGGDRQRTIYANGDEVEYTVVLFAADVVGGELSTAADETIDLRWVAPGDVPEEVRYPREVLEGSTGASVWFSLGGEAARDAPEPSTLYARSDHEGE